MSPLIAVYRRELALAWRAGAAAPIGFFLGATVLAPLAMGPDRDLLATAAAPLIWVTAALAALMTLERLFQSDIEDGSFDQYVLAPVSLTAVTAAKGAALWTAIGLPLALAGAPAALSLQTPPSALPGVVLALCLGMAAFIGAGLVAAALAAQVKRAGVLIALLVLPFFAPPIIFGAAALRGADGAELLLAAVAAAYCALGPPAAAATLRLQLD